MATTIKGYEYKIVEKVNGGFLCAVIKNGKLVGRMHEAPDHESMMAWLRLVIGNYPGMRAIA